MTYGDTLKAVMAALDALMATSRTGSGVGTLATLSDIELANAQAKVASIHRVLNTRILELLAEKFRRLDDAASAELARRTFASSQRGRGKGRTK